MDNNTLILLYYLFLFVFAFTESLINPFPVDLLIIYLIKKNFNLPIVILISLIGNLSGAILAYKIGLKLKKKEKLDYLIEKLKLHTITKSFKKRKNFLLFISTFTPLPYKIFTYLSGFFEMNFILFIFYSIIGRGARYLLVALVASTLTLKQILYLAFFLIPIYIITEKLLTQYYLK